MEDDLEKLEAIFGKVERAAAHYTVYASAKVYPQYVKVFVPNNPYMKKIPFMEDRTDEMDVEDWTSRVIDSNKTSNESNLERSLRQTKTVISDLTLCNEFNLFATFTFSPKKSDRLNPRAVKMQMANWLRNQRKQYAKFPYLIVPEFHKDGRALHFHALFHDYPGVLIKTNKQINKRVVYHFKGYRLGWNSAVKIDDVQKVSNYVRKYITKDMPQFPGQHRFWNSTGLKRPKVIDNPDASIMRREPLSAFENEYGRILILPIEKEERDED